MPKVKDTRRIVFAATSQLPHFASTATKRLSFTLTQLDIRVEVDEVLLICNYVCIY